MPSDEPRRSVARSRQRVIVHVAGPRRRRRGRLSGRPRDAGTRIGHHGRRSAVPLMREGRASARSRCGAWKRGRSRTRTMRWSRPSPTRRRSRSTTCACSTRRRKRSTSSVRPARSSPRSRARSPTRRRSSTRSSTSCERLFAGKVAVIDLVGDGRPRPSRRVPRPEPRPGAAGLSARGGPDDRHRHRDRDARRRALREHRPRCRPVGRVGVRGPSASGRRSARR